MAELSDFECAVIAKLLAGDHPVLIRLREQAEMARVRSREMTGHGFYVYFELPLDVEPLPGSGADFEIGDVVAIIEGLKHDAGFQLFVRRGLLDFLDGYAFVGSWPGKVGRYELRYVREPRGLSLPDVPS